MRKNDLSSWLTPLFVIGLFFTTTNKVVISALPSVAMLLLIPWLLSKNLTENYEGKFYLWLKRLGQQLKAHPITLACGLFFTIAILSVLFYYPQSLLEYRFYRYDGNFIISYAVFLFLPYYQFRYDIEKLFTWFIYFTFVLNIPFLVSFFVNYSDNQYYRYYALFNTTNGAGSFYAIALSLALGHLFYFRQKHMLLISSLLGLMLILTGSRGSVLAVIAATFIWILMEKMGKTMFRWGLVLFITFIISIQAYLVHKYYVVYLDGATAIEYHFAKTHGQTVVKLRNIHYRLIETWPKAWDMISRSPVTGFGFGSFNDTELRRKVLEETKRAQEATSESSLFYGPRSYGDSPSIEYNHVKGYVFNDKHAHHSYLHVMTEQGIIGLLVLLMLWFYQFRFLCSGHGPPWITNGLTIAFWTIIFASFTEHRITTPAMLLPYSLLFLFYYCRPGVQTTV